MQQVAGPSCAKYAELTFLPISNQVITPVPTTFTPPSSSGVLTLPDYLPWDVGIVLWQRPWRHTGSFSRPFQTQLPDVVPDAACPHGQN